MSDDIVFTVVGRAPFGKRELAHSVARMKDQKLDAQTEVVEVVVRGDTASTFAASNAEGRCAHGAHD